MWVVTRWCTFSVDPT
jgi:hypothetical protein